MQSIKNFSSFVVAQASKLAGAGVLVVVLLSGRAYADGIAIGSFCIEGLNPSELLDRTTVGAGEWTTTRYFYDAPSSGRSKAKAVVFEKVVALDPLMPPACDKVKEQAQAQGVKILLEGNIIHAALKVRRLAELGRFSYVIAPRDLVLTIGSVSSGYSKVGGGVLDLKGSQAWVENSQQINITPEGMTGALKVESWSRTLKDAVFVLGPGSRFAASLNSGNKNITLAFDTATATANLLEADLVATNARLKDIKIDGELADLEEADIKVAKVRLLVGNGKTSVSLAEAAGVAKNVVIGREGAISSAERAQVAWKLASASASQTTETFAVGAWAFEHLKLAADKSRASLDGQELISGKAAAEFARLDAANVAGIVKYANPTVSALAFALPAGSVPSAEIKVGGRPDALELSGLLKSTKMTLAGLAFDAAIPLTFQKPASDVEIKFPIEIHAGNLSGTFSARDADQDIMLTAALNRIDLSGELTVNLADIGKSHLDVPQGRFGFALSSTVATKPLLAGTKPAFARLGVEGTNTTALKVRKDGGEGSVEIQTPTLVLGQPILRVGSGGQQVRVALDITAAGRAAIEYSLATSASKLVEGLFDLSNVLIKGVDAGWTADLGSILVDDAQIALDHLKLELKRGDKVGTVAGDGFAVAGSTVRNVPKSPTEVRYSGKIADSLKIARIGGLFSVDGTKIDLTDMILSDASFSIAEAELELGAGMKLKNTSLDLSAAEIRTIKNPAPETFATPLQLTPASFTPPPPPPPPPAPVVAPVAEDGTYYRDLRLRARGDLTANGSFSILNSARVSNLEVLLNGRSDRLNGTGSAEFGGFIGSNSSDLDTGFECDNGGKLRIPVTANLATGPSRLGITAEDGKIWAMGDFAGFAVDITSAKAASCNSTSKRHVVQKEQWGSMTGWCPTWDNPGRTCEWRTIVLPEISYTYHIRTNILALRATVLLSNPRIRLGDKSAFLCNRGPMTLVAPAIIGGYYPQFSDPTVLNHVVNAVVEATAVAVESTIATGLLNGLNVAVNEPTLQAMGTSACLFKGEW